MDETELDALLDDLDTEDGGGEGGRNSEDMFDDSLSDIDSEVRRVSVDYAALSNNEFEAAVAAVKAGRLDEASGESLTSQQVNALAEVAAVAANPAATPKDIMAAVPKRQEPEVIGYVPPEALAAIGLSPNAKVPVTKELVAETNAWLGLVQEQAQRMADRRAAEQAGPASTGEDAQPIDYGSLSGDAILSLADMAQGRAPRQVPGQRELTDADLKRAFGES